jgi:hypothetical protein
MADRPLVCMLSQPRLVHVCGVVCGMRIGRGNGNTCRKPSPVPHCQSDIPYGNEPRPQQWEAGDNRMSYGKTFMLGRYIIVTCLGTSDTNLSRVRVSVTSN